MAKKKSNRASKKVPAAIRKNLIGDVYGQLTVIAFGGYRGTAIMWRCRCECGREGDYYRANLRSGTSKRCLQCNRDSFQSQSTSHGMNRTPIYRTWERVRRSEDCSKKWHSFSAFYSDVGDKPSPDHFFVRKNPAKAWTKANSAWVDKKDVKKVGGTARMLKYKGKTQSLTAWAEEIGITPPSLSGRLKRGWSIKKAIETPKFKPKKKKPKKKKPKKKVRKKKAAKKKTLKKKTLKKKIAKNKKSTRTKNATASSTRKKVSRKTVRRKKR